MAEKDTGTEAGAKGVVEGTKGKLKEAHSRGRLVRSATSPGKKPRPERRGA